MKPVAPARVSEPLSLSLSLSSLCWRGRNQVEERCEMFFKPATCNATNRKEASNLVRQKRTTSRPPHDKETNAPVPAAAAAYSLFQPLNDKPACQIAPFGLTLTPLSCSPPNERHGAFRKKGRLPASSPPPPHHLPPPIISSHLQMSKS